MGWDVRVDGSGNERRVREIFDCSSATGEEECIGSHSQSECLHVTPDGLATDKVRSVRVSLNPTRAHWTTRLEIHLTDNTYMCAAFI